jgi:hypothetical protein
MPAITITDQTTDAEVTLSGFRLFIPRQISRFAAPLVIIPSHPRQLVEARKSNGVCDV